MWYMNTRKCCLRWVIINYDYRRHFFTRTSIQQSTRGKGIQRNALATRMQQGCNTDDIHTYVHTHKHTYVHTCSRLRIKRVADVFRVSSYVCTYEVEVIGNDKCIRQMHKKSELRIAPSYAYV